MDNSMSLTEKTPKIINQMSSQYLKLKYLLIRVSPHCFIYCVHNIKTL